MDNIENFPKNESAYISQYQKKGFKDNFRIVDQKLVASTDKKGYGPNEIKVVAEHRFEGMSNPSDLSILYVIVTKDDGRGTLLCAYGPNGNLDGAEFFKEVPKDKFTNESNIDLETNGDEDGRSTFK